MPTFTHGKHARVCMDSIHLSDYARSVTVSSEADQAESSTFGADWKQYVGGLRDATVSAEGLFSVEQDAAIMAAFGAATKSVWQVYFAGDAVGQAGRGVICDTTSYEPSSDLGDAVQWSAEAQSSNGAERILSHHPHSRETTSGTAAVVDGGAQSTGGGVAFLNVTAINGSAVITIQDSADNITFADVVSFGTVTAPGGLRAAVAGTVDRYTRLVHTNAAGTITFTAGFGRTI